MWVIDLLLIFIVVFLVIFANWINSKYQILNGEVPLWLFAMICFL